MIPKVKKRRVVRLRHHRPKQGAYLAGVVKILSIAIKGGVLKSTVAAVVARALCNDGYHVGLLDADFSGSNAFNVLMNGDDVEVTIDHEGYHPVDADGIQLMGLSVFGEDTAAVIWDGKDEANAVKSMLLDTKWRALDYLIIDCPPGSGDITQMLLKYVRANDQVVLVTQETPSAIQDAKRTIDLMHTMNVHITGVVPTMSKLVCPYCVREIATGDVGAAQQLGLPILFSIPNLPYHDRTIEYMTRGVDFEGWLPKYQVGGGLIV